MPVREELKERLLNEAREAAKHAHCPHSKFPVGASLLTTDEKIYRGCNVENASLALSICAARNAVFQAVSQGDTDILMVVIYTPTKEPTPPCGACRQVINEFSTNAHVYCICDTPQYLHRRLSELLPDAFGPHLL